MSLQEEKSFEISKREVWQHPAPHDGIHPSGEVGEHGHDRARLLDLVPGRSGKAYVDWLTARGDGFRKRGARRHL